MTGILRKFILVVPNDQIGDVIAEINRKRGWIDDSQCENQTAILTARLYVQDIAGLQEWLKKNIRGNYEINFID